MQRLQQLFGDPDLIIVPIPTYGPVDSNFETSAVEVDEELCTESRPDCQEIIKVISNENLMLKQRATVAAMIGYSEGTVKQWQSAAKRVIRSEAAANAFRLAAEEADVVPPRPAAIENAGASTGTAPPKPAAPPAPPAPPSAAAAPAPPEAPAAAQGTAASASTYNPKFLGKWLQESMEAEKLDAILKIQKYPWAIRKIACKTKLNMTFSIDADGDLLYSSKVPVQGEQRLKCIDGNSLELKLMGGVTMVMTAQWVDGALALHQETRTGQTTTTATITQRYDAKSDTIISENESIEGFYTRTFARAK